MQPLNKQASTKQTKAIFCGYPNSGKSTAAMFSPKPLWIYQYDTCEPLENVPGVDYSDGKVQVEKYPPADVDLDKDSYQRSRNIGDKVLKDLLACKKAILDGNGPATILLDGWVNALRHLHNRNLRIDGMKDEDDYTSQFTPWRKRLKTALDLWDLVVPLPVNVIITTWPGEERKEQRNAQGKSESVKTGALTPELGGQFDIYGPGKVNACLYFYCDAGKYFVRCKSNAQFKGFGVKDRYDLPESGIIDVTLGAGKADPWQTLFGK